MRRGSHAVLDKPSATCCLGELHGWFRRAFAPADDDPTVGVEIAAGILVTAWPANLDVQLRRFARPEVHSKVALGDSVSAAANFIHLRRSPAVTVIRAPTPARHALDKFANSIDSATGPLACRCMLSFGTLTANESAGTADCWVRNYFSSPNRRLSFLSARSRIL